jgi:hypothetical protein
MAVSIEEPSYQPTADALAEQERSLSGLRTRAGTVLAAASISGSFLGAKANHGSLDVFAALALGAFVLCLARAIWILLPHHLVFAFRAETRCSRERPPGACMTSLRPIAPLGSGSSPSSTRTATESRLCPTWFTISGALLALEVILWTVSVAG